MVNTFDTKDIYDIISDIPDPEIPVINIKDLGILRGVNYINDTYEVDITPTYTACPAMGLIENQIKGILNGIGVSNVKVNLVYTPAWSTDWLSNQAKLKLKHYGIAPPMHSSCSKIKGVQSAVACPRCNSTHTHLISQFGSTACKALYQCDDCKEAFDLFKCH